MRAQAHVRFGTTTVADAYSMYSNIVTRVTYVVVIANRHSGRTDLLLSAVTWTYSRWSRCHTLARFGIDVFLLSAVGLLSFL